MCFHAVIIMDYYYKINCFSLLQIEICSNIIADLWISRMDD